MTSHELLKMRKTMKSTESEKMDKTDLKNRLYPITHHIHQVAVAREVTPNLVRLELSEALGINVTRLSQLENAKKGEKGVSLLQVVQQVRMNKYFSQHLGEQIRIMAQLEIFDDDTAITRMRKRLVAKNADFQLVKIS
jgi:hypothetical protein